MKETGEISVGRFLVTEKYGYKERISEMHVLEVSNTSIKFSINKYDQWMQKEDFWSKYQILEQLITNPSK